MIYYNKNTDTDDKVGCVFPMVIWQEIRIDGVHSQDAPHFSSKERKHKVSVKMLRLTLKVKFKCRGQNKIGSTRTLTLTLTF